MTSTHNTTSGYHLFFEPNGELKAQLEALVAELATKHRGLVFPPHVTLCSHIPDAPLEEVSAKALLLAQKLAPLTLKLAQAAGEPEYFRNLYLHIVPTEELLHAHEIAQEIFEQSSTNVYMPHLSLYYGALTPSEQQENIAALDLPVRESFIADTLYLYKTEGTAEEWRQVGAFPLG